MFKTVALSIMILFNFHGWAQYAGYTLSKPSGNI